jgi:hypothetical protein
MSAKDKAGDAVAAIADRVGGETPTYPEFSPAKATRSATASTFALTPHAAIALTFLAFGVGAGLWSGASAALLARTGVDPATFGLTLTGYTCVYLFAMSSASTLGRKVTIKRVVIGAAILICPTLAIVLTAASPIALIGGLLLYAFAAGALDA